MQVGLAMPFITDYNDNNFYKAPYIQNVVYQIIYFTVIVVMFCLCNYYVLSIRSFV